MQTRVGVLFVVLIAAGCSSVNQPTSSSSQSSQRSYNGTASVGDFMNITIDNAALTITYKNLSNGDQGTVPYTVNTDGSYTLSDPTGNLVSAYEIPDYAMLLAAKKTGADHATPALITAVAAGPISLGTFASHNYNYMQFRTTAGGLEAGSADLDAQGNITISSYWPFGATNQQQSPFNHNTMSGSGLTEDSSGTFLKMTNQGETDYVFGTPSGIFIVDTANGAVMGLKQATTKNFDATFAGTYKATFYQKTNATTGQGNIETGTPSLGNATLVVDAQANLTIQDSTGQAIVQTTLTPVADAPYLYGSAGQLNDPCFGLFTFRITTASSQQDVFVTFMDRAVLFSSFTAQLPLQASNPYAYLYGVGLK